MDGILQLQLVTTLKLAFSTQKTSYVTAVRLLAVTLDGSVCCIYIYIYHREPHKVDCIL